jgi:hypothetical protein
MPTVSAAQYKQFQSVWHIACVCTSMHQYKFNTFFVCCRRQPLGISLYTARASQGAKCRTQSIILAEKCHSVVGEASCNSTIYAKTLLSLVRLFQQHTAPSEIVATA